MKSFIKTFFSQDAKLNRKANAAYLNKDYEKAIKYIQEAAMLKDSRCQTICSFVFLALKHSDSIDILSVLDEILANNTTLSKEEIDKIELHKCLVYWKADDLENALNLSKKIFEIDKQSFAYELYGFFLIQSGKLEEALKVNKEGVEIKNTTDVIRTNLGETYFKLERFAKSKEIFEELIKKHVKYVEPHYYLGLIEKMHGNNEKALTTLESAYYCPHSLLTGVKKEDIRKNILELDPNYEFDDE